MSRRIALMTVTLVAMRGPLADAQAGADVPLAAVEAERLGAPEAHQGVAASRDSIYAVANSTVARYDKVTHKRLAIWNGDPARFPHLNSCVINGRDLVCAFSNYPATPMHSQVLWLDARTLTYKRIHDLGHGHGSLTWFLPHAGNWWAAYANYDGRGGEPGRDHTATLLVRYDRQFHETGQWHFPADVLARMAPKSASGGAWGKDGLLYVTGHDRPEIYVLRVPKSGDTLEHVTTIASVTDGQAIAWDPAEHRILWSIERGTEQMVASRIPPVPAALLSRSLLSRPLLSRPLLSR
ncbi:hypothetical protein [Novosphingobium sp. 9]|uniref:hypothetical protein n=1 Tax=Novosphingobium sp. 9 TaxID=2025349 RepID=UPI0021B62A0F|nr:hypothetical protein [Novosphingobium sp. 9]